MRAERTAQAHARVADVALHRLSDWAIDIDARVRVAPTSGRHMVFASKGRMGSNANYSIWYRNDGGTLKLASGFDDAGGSGSYIAEAALTLTLNRWYRFAAEWDDTAKDLTIWYAPRDNGDQTEPSNLTLVATANHAGVTPDTTGGRALIVGAADNGSATVQDGTDADVQEFALYSAAIGKAAHEATLTTRVEGDASNLVGLWRFDEGTGATAYDRAIDTATPAGRGNDLTLKNGARWSPPPPDLYYPTRGIDRAFIGIESVSSRRGATITGSADATNYPASLMRAPSPELRGRTTGTSASWVLHNPGGAPVTALRIADGHNLTSGASIVWEAHTADSWGSPDFTANVTYAPDAIVHIATGWPLGYAYHRLVVADASNPDGYLELKAEWWTIWEPSFDSLYVAPRATSDRSTRVDTRLLAEAGKRSHDVAWGQSCRWLMPTADARELQRLARTISIGWLCHDPRRELYRSHVGRLVPTGQVLSDPVGYYREIGVSVSEEAA